MTATLTEPVRIDFSQLEEFEGRRLVRRRVDEDGAIRSCIDRLAGDPTKTMAWSVSHGGSVCNSYGYPAETEYVVACAVRNGSVVYAYRWVGRMPANKCTIAGAWRHAGYTGLGSGATSEATKKRIREVLRRDVVDYGIVVARIPE